MPLPQDLQTKLSAGLDPALWPGLNFAFAQNPALLGGLRIKVGSDVYDDRVQARLNALAEGF